MTKTVDNSGARRLISGGAWFLGLMVLSGVFWLLLGVQIGRSYGPDGFGLFNIAQSVFDFMWAFIFGGIFEGIIHFGTGYLTKKDSSISSYFSNYIRYLTLMSLILFSFLIILSFQTSDIIFSTILVSIAVAFLFSGTKDALSAIVGSLHRNKQLSIINSSGFYVVSIIGMIFILLNVPFHLLPLLIIFAPVSQLILCMYFLREYLKDLFKVSINFYKTKNIKQRLIDDFKQFKHILFFGFSISIGKISFMVMKSLDIPVLILFFNYSNVGIYSVADTASSVLFSMTAFSLPILSSISEAWAKQDKTLVEDYAKISVKYPLILGIPLTVLIFALADPIVTGIYGTDFLGAVIPLQILIFGTFLLMFGHTLSSILIGIGKPKISGILMAGSAIQYLVSLFILVPILGFNGAAISLTLTGVTTLGLIPILIRRTLKVDIFSGFYKVIFSGAILALILYVIRESSPIVLFFGIAAGIAVYVLLLRYTGYLTNEDIALLKAARVKS